MKRKNLKKVTEDQVRNAVKSKVQRMQMELNRNPMNTKTAERLAEFKKIHRSKL